MNVIIRSFTNKTFGTVRVIMDDDNKIWLCGKDIATMLGYKNKIAAIQRHCVREKRKYSIHTNGGDQTMVFIQEQDLYRIITHSRLSNSIEFENWIYNILTMLKLYK